MRRREFITLLGTAAGWPLTASAQQRDRQQRIGVLMNFAADDSEATARIAVLVEGLRQRGCVVGHNLHIDYRWAAQDLDCARGHADQLVALQPDVIMASGSPSVAALLLATRTVPIVFGSVIDPIGSVGRVGDWLAGLGRSLCSLLPRDGY